MASIPVCMIGVLLIARPSFIFGRGSKTDSRVGVALGIAQVSVCRLSWAETCLAGSLFPRIVLGMICQPSRVT